MAASPAPPNLADHASMGARGALRQSLALDQGHEVSVAALGRTSTFGNGPSIAPLQYTVMPSVVHRFGQLMVLASFTYGKYVASEGYDVSGALRVQYRWKLGSDSRFKLYGKLLAARDIDESQQEIRSGSASLGAQYTW